MNSSSSQKYLGLTPLQFAANTTVSGTGLLISEFYSGPIGASLGGGYFAGGLISINMSQGVAPTAQMIIQPISDLIYNPPVNNPNIIDSFESNENSPAHPFP